VIAWKSSSRSVFLTALWYFQSNLMDSEAKQRRAIGFAQAIRVRRKSMGLTQIALAKLTGCGPDFVYDVEVGKPSLRFDKLLDVLEVLGIELVLCEGKNVLRVSMDTSAKVPR
jgi:HTH-type transcriptional regulator / antitoxin HipB